MTIAGKFIITRYIHCPFFVKLYILNTEYVTFSSDGKKGLIKVFHIIQEMVILEILVTETKVSGFLNRMGFLNSLFMCLVF